MEDSYIVKEALARRRSRESMRLATYSKASARRSRWLSAPQMLEAQCAQRLRDMSEGSRGGQRSLRGHATRGPRSTVRPVVSSADGPKVEALPLLLAHPTWPQMGASFRCGCDLPPVRQVRFLRVQRGKRFDLLGQAAGPVPNRRMTSPPRAVFANRFVKPSRSGSGTRAPPTA
jgi:hypothetical protein